jgi:hypothetical protein
VKRTGSDEPIWVVIHISMLTTEENSLCNYLSQASKNVMFLFCFFLAQNQRTGRQNKFWGRGFSSGGRGEVAREEVGG